MSDARRSLTVLDSCDGCGACCRVVSRPPFYTQFDGEGEDAWERLKRERPDLFAAFLADTQARRSDGGPFYGTPCTWYDAANARCLHYAYRPSACRAFSIGSVDCHDARRRAGVGATAGAVPNGPKIS